MGKINGSRVTASGSRAGRQSLRRDDGTRISRQSRPSGTTACAYGLRQRAWRPSGDFRQPRLSARCQASPPPLPICRLATTPQDRLRVRADRGNAKPARPLSVNIREGRGSTLTRTGIPASRCRASGHLDSRRGRLRGWTDPKTGALRRILWQSLTAGQASMPECLPCQKSSRRANYITIRAPTYHHSVIWPTFTPSFG